MRGLFAGAAICLSMVGCSCGGMGLPSTDAAASPMGTALRAPAPGDRQPVALAARMGGGTSLAIDGTRAYWTNLNGQVVTIALGGGSPELLNAGPGAFALAVDSANVYWTNQEGGQVLKVPLAGGPALILATDANQPAGIAVDSAWAYWVDAVGGAIHKVPLAGGAPVTLFDGNGTGLEIDNPSIAVDSTQVYWTNPGKSADPGAGLIQAGPLAGSAALLALRDQQTRPTAIAVDSTNLYWISQDRGNGEAGGSVEKLALAGGYPVTLAAHQHPLALAVDGATVYWSNDPVGVPHGGTVMQVDRGGGAPVAVASGVGQVRAIAVDQASIYWSDSTDGSIMKAPK